MVSYAFKSYKSSNNSQMDLHVLFMFIAEKNNNNNRVEEKEEEKGRTVPSQLVCKQIALIHHLNKKRKNN